MRRFVSKGREKKTKKKKQWDENHKGLSVAREVHERLKKIKFMRVYSSDTAFARHLLSFELILTDIKLSRAPAWLPSRVLALYFLLIL